MSLSSAVETLYDGNLPTSIWTFLSSSWTIAKSEDCVAGDFLFRSTDAHNATMTVPQSNNVVNDVDTMILSPSFWNIWIALGIVAAPRFTALLIYFQREPAVYLQILQSCLTGLTQKATLPISFNMINLISFATSFVVCPSFIFLVPALQLRYTSPAAAILIAWSALVFGTGECVTSLLYFINHWMRDVQVSSSSSPSLAVATDDSSGTLESSGEPYESYGGARDARSDVQAAGAVREEDVVYPNDNERDNRPGEGVNNTSDDSISRRLLSDFINLNDSFGENSIDISAVFRDMQSGDLILDSDSDASFLMYLSQCFASSVQFVWKFFAYWITVVAGEIIVALWLAVMAADIKFFTYPHARTLMHYIERQLGEWHSVSSGDATGANYQDDKANNNDEAGDILLFQSVMICEAILAIVMGLSIRVGAWMFMLPNRDHSGLQGSNLPWRNSFRILDFSLLCLFNIERNMNWIINRTFGSSVFQGKSKIESINFPSPLDIPAWYEPSDERYRCPITLMPMREPSIATSSGITYERSAVERWMTKHNNEPITRSCIKSRKSMNKLEEATSTHNRLHIVPNLLIRALIEEDVEKAKESRKQLTEKIFTKRECKELTKRRRRPTSHKKSLRIGVTRKRSTEATPSNIASFHVKPNSWPELNESSLFVPTLGIFERKGT